MQNTDKNTDKKKLPMIRVLLRFTGSKRVARRSETVQLLDSVTQEYVDAPLAIDREKINDLHYVWESSEDEIKWKNATKSEEARRSQYEFR